MQDQTPNKFIDRPIGRRSALRGIITIAGISVALPAMTSLAGCSQAPSSITDKADLISAVAGRIIPQTDTPGAVEAGVPDYIAAVFEQYFTAEQRSVFADGLDAFEAMAKDKGAESFATASDSVKDQILTAFDQGKQSMSGHETWRSLREITIFGYYTSEAATKELNFEELPGRYNGCVPMEEVGRAWLDRGV